MNKLKKYFWNIFVASDQFLNACSGGDPQETISSRADKAMRAGKAWGCILCKLLGKIQKRHCQLSLEETVGKNAVIPDDSAA